MMRIGIGIAALFIVFYGTAAAQTATRKEGETLKERLSDKASDEQRVNDCKVPVERRGATQRPTDCGKDQPSRKLDAVTGAVGSSSVATDAH